jgi:amino acid transporter
MDAVGDRNVATTTLAPNSIGVVQQLFQSITHIAPAAGTILSVQFMATQGGASHPLAFLLALVGALLAAYSLRQLVRKIHTAGGYFTIHSIALGRFWGFVTSWLYFLYDPLVPAGLLLAFGSLILEPFSAAHGFTIPWWVTLVVGTLILTALTASGVKQSAAGVVTLGAFEVGIMILLSIILIIKAPNGQDLSTFTPASSPHAWAGVAFATIFSFASFTGFESGIPLSEETKDAGGALTFTVMLSTLIVGLIFCLVGYATVVGWGGTANPAKFATDFSSASDPFGSVLSQRAFGAIGPWVIVFVLFNSTFAVSIAGWNATTRVYYSLGRAGILPKPFARVSQGSRVPIAAILFQAALTIAAGLVMSWVFGGPVNAVGVAFLLYGLALGPIYIVTNFSVIRVYYRKFRNEFNWIKHAILPVIATLVWLVPLVASVVANPTAPLSYSPYIVIAWFIIGLAFFFYLRARQPQSFERLVEEMEVTHVEPETSR